MTNVNVNRLKGKIVESGLSVGDLAMKIGINRATLYRKIGEGGGTFLVREVNAITAALGLSVEEAMDIFFNHNVA